MKEQFTEFISKKKFEEDSKIFYPGLVDKKLRLILTKKINEVATDFKNVSESEKPNDKKYQEKIGIGLSRFADLYLDLDTEDRERVCSYFEEIMDIVGQESSNGQLNKFMYGFDPTKLINNNL